MKTILYMAITVNGMIAKEDDDTSFTSPEDWKSLIARTQDVGNMIVGRRTYDLMIQNDDLPKFNKVLIVVLTRNETLTSNKENVFVTAKSPQEVLDYLQHKGFQSALIAGGAELNLSFMTAGLIDEIYLDVEPTILGKGIPLFKPEAFEYQLKLLETKKLNQNTVQLHYKVKH